MLQALTCPTKSICKISTKLRTEPMSLSSARTAQERLLNIARRASSSGSPAEALWPNLSLFRHLSPFSTLHFSTGMRGEKERWGTGNHPSFFFPFFSSRFLLSHSLLQPRSVSYPQPPSPPCPPYSPSRHGLMSSHLFPLPG